MPFNPVGWLKAIKDWTVWQWRQLVDWLGPDIRAVAGRINARELAKAVVLGLSSGGLVAIVQTVTTAANAIFVDPDDASNFTAAVTVIVFMLDLLRRRKQDASSRQMPAAPRKENSR